MPLSRLLPFPISPLSTFSLVSPRGAVLGNLLENELAPVLNLVAQRLDVVVENAELFTRTCSGEARPDGNFQLKPFFHGVDQRHHFSCEIVFANLLQSRARNALRNSGLARSGPENQPGGRSQPLKPPKKRWPSPMSAAFVHAKGRGQRLCVCDRVIAGKYWPRNSRRHQAPVRRRVAKSVKWYSYTSARRYRGGRLGKGLVSSSVRT